MSRRRSINGSDRGNYRGLLGSFGIGIRAAGAVSGEREKQTLDNLLTTPLATKRILFAKWLGEHAKRSLAHSFALRDLELGGPDRRAGRILLCHG